MLLRRVQRQQRECCDEIKHNDKVSSTTLSTQQTHRLDSLELQSLQPESPIDPTDVFLQAGEKLRAERKKERRRRNRERGEGKEPDRQAKYMSLFMWGEQQFTCLFKFMLARQLWRLPERSPPILAKGNISASKRNKCAMVLMGRLLLVCVKPPVKYWKHTVSIIMIWLDGFYHVDTLQNPADCTNCEWYDIKLLERNFLKNKEKGRTINTLFNSITWI